MDDAAGVRGGDAAGDLLGVAGGAPRIEQALVQPVAQRLAVDQFRDDEGRPSWCPNS